MRMITRVMLTARTGTATSNNQERPASSLIAMTTPPSIMIGAVTISVQPSSTSI